MGEKDRKNADSPASLASSEGERDSDQSGYPWENPSGTPRCPGGGIRNLAGHAGLFPMGPLCKHFPEHGGSAHTVPCVWTGPSSPLPESATYLSVPGCHPSLLYLGSQATAGHSQFLVPIEGGKGKQKRRDLSDRGICSCFLVGRRRGPAFVFRAGQRLTGSFPPTSQPHPGAGSERADPMESGAVVPHMHGTCVYLTICLWKSLQFKRK